MNSKIRSELEKLGYKKEFAILNVNFGSIDSESDANLFDYFLDDDYIEKIVNSNIYFITGRKGTGKTALFKWIKYSEMKYGYFCSNMNLTNLNQGDFQSLTDDNKASYSVYQTIWEYTTLCEIARMIVKDDNHNFHSVDYQNIKQYVNFFFNDNLLDMHKLVTNFATKKGVELIGPPLRIFYGRHQNYTLDKSKFVSLSIVNKTLFDTISNYLHDSEHKQFILQFDGLDNDYNYEAFNNYKKIIISLLTAIYTLNNQFKQENLSIKVLAYLRSDIFRAVHDFHPNSAKWEFLKYELDWSVKFENDLPSSKIKKMIDIRIRKSLSGLSIDDDPFEFLFKQLDYEYDSRQKGYFSEYIKKTMFRPRDLVALCIYTQKNIRSEKIFTRNVYKNIQKEYLQWFWNEISNEINTIIQPSILKRFIQRLGNGILSYTEGEKIFNDFSQREKLINNYLTNKPFEYQELMEYLFKFGIIVNAEKNKGVNHYKYLSIIRNPLVEFNYKLDICVNECLHNINKLHSL